MSGLVEAFEDNVGTGGEITGSGTANTLAMFTGTQTIGNSVVTQQPNGLDPTVTDVLVAGNFMPSTTAIYTCGATGNFWANVYTNSVTGSATGLAFAGTVATSGAITAFTYTVPANTGQLASAEIPSEKYNGGSRQWATGAITTQRERWQTTTTYTAVGASTITNAYGFYVEAPTASTNITITNNWAIGGNSSIYFTGTKNNLGNASLNTTAFGALRIGQGTSWLDFGEQSGGDAGVWASQATNLNSNYIIRASSTTTRINATTLVHFNINNSSRGNYTDTAWAFTPNAATSGSTSIFSYTIPANTGQTASTEVNGEKYNGGSRQWATGAITTQRERYQTTTTYTAVGASTITNAYGMYIEAPTASTNITITNNYAAGFIGNVAISNGSAATNLSLFGTASGSANVIIDRNSNALSASVVYRTNSTAAWAVGLNSTTSSENLCTVDSVANVVRMQMTAGGSSRALTGWRYTPASNTGQTASTEIQSELWDSFTRTWATGAITTQRDTYYKTVTYAFGGASTITNAYRLYVEAATAGSNATITNNWAAGFEGSVKIISVSTNKSFDITSTASKTLRVSSDGTGPWIGSLTNDNFRVLVNNGAFTPLIFDTSGHLTVGEGSNIILGTTIGSKIGTATTQKMGFWNATPIVQPTTAIAAATFVANTSGIANDTATFDGYTIGQVVKALRNTGLLA